MTPWYGAVDLGGTHVASAVVGYDGTVVDDTRHRRTVEPDMPAEVLLQTIAAPLRDTARAASVSLRGWGMAAPGPFDYDLGICLYEGVAKFDALYGVNLRAELAHRVGTPADHWRFLNDASAFALGEAHAGAAMGHARVLGVTLGTGLGSGFVVRGEVVEDGKGVPSDGRLDWMPFEGAPAEERLSRRGLLRSYGAEPGVDVVDVVRRARAGEARAAAAVDAFARGLARFLAPWVAEFGATCLVVGGGIAQAWDLLAPALATIPAQAPHAVDVRPSALGGDAPLVGAMVWASDPSGLPPG